MSISQITNIKLKESVYNKNHVAHVFNKSIQAIIEIAAAALMALVKFLQSMISKPQLPVEKIIVEETPNEETAVVLYRPIQIPLPLEETTPEAPLMIEEELPPTPVPNRRGHIAAVALAVSAIFCTIQAYSTPEIAPIAAHVLPVATENNKPSLTLYHGLLALGAIIAYKACSSIVQSFSRPSTESESDDDIASDLSGDVEELESTVDDVQHQMETEFEQFQNKLDTLFENDQIPQNEIEQRFLSDQQDLLKRLQQIPENFKIDRRIIKQFNEIQFFMKNIENQMIRGDNRKLFLTQ